MSKQKFQYPKSGELVELADSIAESNSAPDPELFALLAKTTIERSDLTPQQLAHYRRMMALQMRLITNMTDETRYNPEEWQAIQFLVGRELSELKGFKEDLSDLTGPWKLALYEVLDFYGDPDAEQR